MLKAKENKSEMEFKKFHFQLEECKKSDTGNYGYFSGAMATTDVDRVNDIIAEGAFDNTIKDYKAENRNIKLYYNHNSNDLPIGIIDPASIKFQDGKWLVKGEINLDTQLGKDVYALMKQKALSDLSIGFSVIDFSFNAQTNSRIILVLYLWEVSVVGEPANTKAKIKEVKKFEINEIENNISSKKDFETILRDSGVFSKKAATYLASFLKDDLFLQSDSEEKELSTKAELLKEAISLLKQ